MTYQKTATSFLDTLLVSRNFLPFITHMSIYLYNIHIQQTVLGDRQSHLGRKYSSQILFISLRNM